MESEARVAGYPRSRFGKHFTLIELNQLNEWVMNKLCRLLLLVSLAGFIVGLLDVGGSIFSGLARAMGAIFFILFFITTIFNAAAAEH